MRSENFTVNTNNCEHYSHRTSLQLSHTTIVITPHYQLSAHQRISTQLPKLVILQSSFSSQHYDHHVIILRERFPSHREYVVWHFADKISAHAKTTSLLSDLYWYCYYNACLSERLDVSLYMGLEESLNKSFMLIVQTDSFSLYFWISFHCLTFCIHFPQ